MHLADLARYLLYADIVYTADANRRHYHMRSTWLSHLALNTVTLLLPDALRPLLRHAPRPHASDPLPQQTLATLAATLRTLVCDNTAYVGYVAPLAAGYLLSHPEFNIYKGEWGEMNLLGFGFDTLPHSATGFTFSLATIDALREAQRQVPPESTLAPLLARLAERPALVALAALALITVVWETNEYRTHRSELAKRGSADKINMQWSAGDTATDALSNLFGWAAAAALRAR